MGKTYNIGDQVAKRDDLGWAWKPSIHDHEPIPEVGTKVVGINPAKYKFSHIKKRSGKVHILDASGVSLCLFENGSNRKIVNCHEIPKDRLLCSTCRRLKAKGPNCGKVSRKEKTDFYTSYEWAELRYKAFLQQGRECVVCGNTRNLTVDHIKPLSKYPELKNELSNMQVMCRLCNRGKGAWDQTDWREKC